MKNLITCKDLLTTHPFIPVVVLNDETKAIPLANALLAGGIKIMEITLRVPNALKIIELIHKTVPEMTVGAGTVLTDDQYHKAVKHGAQFIVSPGLTSNLVEVSNDYDVPFLPGVITPTEIITAVNYGFKYLKFFPAENFNGLNTLKSYESVFSEVKFCPTGGITISNIPEYLKLKNVVSVGCSFLAQQKTIEQNNFEEITALAKQVSLLGNPRAI